MREMLKITEVLSALMKLGCLFSSTPKKIGAKVLNSFACDSRLEISRSRFRVQRVSFFPFAVSNKLTANIVDIGL